jgi:hypothetical protein
MGNSKPIIQRKILQMILNEEQIKHITNEGSYECVLSKQRFSTAFFEDPSPLGSIITFESPVAIGPVEFKKSLVICAELPNTNIFGGVCFQRLYSAQLGSILSNFLNKPCYVNENCLFVDQEQASIVVVNQLKTSIMIHIFLPIIVSEDGNNGLYEIKLVEDKMKELKEHCVNSFHHLTRSLFLETQRDNI